MPNEDTDWASREEKAETGPAGFHQVVRGRERGVPVTSEMQGFYGCKSRVWYGLPFTLGAWSIG